jgi:hypothetical protein
MYSGSFNSPSDKDGTFKGQTASINIGYLGDSFMAGICLEKGAYTFSDDFSTNTYTQYLGGGAGSFLGFHFFDRWKIWTGYLNTLFEPTKKRSIRYFGQQVSFGIGYRLIDGLMFNIEGFKNQFTQSEDDSTGKTQSLQSNIKTQGMGVSLSYIFVL